MKKTVFHLLIILVLVTVGYISASEEQLFQSDIKFDHQNHADLECPDCHGIASESVLSEDKLYPEMDVCADCHNIDDDENCGICHRNTDEPEASPNPKREISFSHKKHHELEVDCTVCHRMSGTINIPGKLVCMNCHDSHMASDDCSLCHGTNYSLIDIHPLNWRRQHGDPALAEIEFCNS